MAGVSAERQESGVIQAINNAVRKNKNQPIIVVCGSTKITNVSGAKKYTGRQYNGSEPYTDVILKLKNRKDLNLSLKGESAPSLGGGGFAGLESIIPGIVGKFMKSALKRHLKMGLEPGEKVPDVYGKISKLNKEKIVVGTAAMGGPIDYMYTGPMDVKSTYDPKKNMLFLNGNLTESKTFAKTYDLYFRLRARRDDQVFDPNATQGGIPKIYSRSPSRGDSAGRIVITNSVPKNAIIVEI